jgi:hypothetical protein
MSFNEKIFSSSQPSLRTISWIGHFFFLIYFCFSWHYFLERSVAFDGAFYSFKMLYYNGFNIENGRWGVFYTQLIPLLLMKCGASLKTFLLSYSISYALWNYFFFLILIKYFKNTVIALGYILSLILFYRYSFFYPVSEIHSTIGPLFILAASIYKFSDIIALKKERPYKYAFVILALIFWVSSIHVISMIPVCFLFVYHLIDRRLPVKENIILYGIFVLTIVFLVLKIALIPKNSYEGSKLITLDSFLMAFTNVENVAGYYFVKKELFGNYLLPLLFALAAIQSLLIRKDFYRAGFVIISIIGFWGIVMSYNIKPDAPLNYQNYLCYFGVLIAFPLVQDFLFKFSKPVFIGLLALLLLFCFYRVVKSGVKFTDRTAYLKRTVQNLRKQGSAKFAICEWNIPPVTVWADWNFPFESLLISSLDGKDSSVTFYAAINIWEFDHYTKKDPKSFIGITFLPDWWQLRADTIETAHFKLKEGFYRQANSLQDASFPDTLFTKENMKISLKEHYSLLRNDTRQIEVEIFNNTDANFSTYVTNEKTIWLSYHLYSKTGEPITYEGARTNIEVDIPPRSSIKTGLSINLGTIEKGNYLLEVDILHENKRWFGINQKTNLKVF